MQTKLTLRMDSDLIEEAKRVAEERNISLSRMVADFLRALTKGNRSTRLHDLPPTTQALYGALRKSPTTRAREDYRDFLRKKYS